MSLVILQYASGAIQVKKCIKKCYRLYGCKLNGVRPVKVFLSIDLKHNLALHIFIKQMAHPVNFKGVSYI